MNHVEDNQVNELPLLEESYPLSSEQIDSYQRDGHIVLRGVASDAEIASYEPIITEWVKSLNDQDKPLEQRDTYGKAFIQISNLWEKSEEIRQFVFAKRYAQIAADLMGRWRSDLS